MTLFWLLCAALLVLALSFLVWPLWRKSAADNQVLRDAANLEILRDQASELEADLKSGLLTQDAFEQGKRELQARLLEEVKGADVQPPARNARKLAVVLALLIPIGSVLFYLKLGNVTAMQPPEQQAESAAGFGTLKSEAALQ